ncbi:hypothetical protein [Lysobacter gummosus]|uniref:hypothetical protein n=1 Tax=Lysobacter gummosus TaxID=262324 RepID=UPI00362B9B07
MPSAAKNSTACWRWPKPASPNSCSSSAKRWRFKRAISASGSGRFPIRFAAHGAFPTTRHASFEASGATASIPNPESRIPFSAQAPITRAHIRVIRRKFRCPR